MEPGPDFRWPNLTEALWLAVFIVAFTVALVALLR
jgi:hypothetical protein